ncbi:hypothetical protein BJY00DRAFT_326832 [Aspergillus carlsbadensis]|nr:hypothetical protein BJY00DRAFT_326832 [Aspergillus carlsbadensis]
MSRLRPFSWAIFALGISILLATLIGVNADDDDDDPFGPPPSQNPLGAGPDDDDDDPFGPPPSTPGSGSVCPSPWPSTAQAGLGNTTTANCPTDDGKLYATSSGDYMYIQCCAERQNGRLLGADAVADFGECMDLCMKDKTGQCRSVMYSPESTGRQNGQNCVLWAHSGFSPDETLFEISHHAYYVEAPYVDQPDDEIELCSTQCPGANNQVFTSNYGEPFLMICGKRHGTPGASQYVDSYEQCIDMCGLMGPCNSVDYHHKTGRCTFGDHSGEPMIDAPGYASAWSMGCAGACTEYPKPPPPPADKMCPDKYHEAFWSSGGLPFQSRCTRYEWTGNVGQYTLDPSPVTMEECMKKCSDDNGCRWGTLELATGKCTGYTRKYNTRQTSTEGKITDYVNFEKLPASPTA